MTASKLTASKSTAPNSTAPKSSAVPPELFRPRSVVIVGASADRTKLSNKPLSNLLGLGYAGRIHVVNPSASEIEGVASFPDIASLPDTPDLAFLVVPGKLALQAAADCARRGVKAAIVASTGFAESGGEGIARQEALTQLTRDHGIRFVGPNTNGLYSAHDRLSLGYNSAHEEAFPAGSVSIASHSGALFNAVAERMRTEGVGLSKFVAVGNEADLDLLDFFEHLVEDETSKIILLILEAVRDGERFRRIAHRAQELGKRVAALKLGTSNAGAASTAAHSSRLAGSARAYAALFRSAGVGSVSSVEALVAFARLVQSTPPQWRPTGRGLGLITASGAGGTLLADCAARASFEVAALSQDTRDRLDAHNPGASIFNPLDVASFGSSKNTPVTAPLLIGDDTVDAVAAFAHKLQTPPQREAFTLGIAQGSKAAGKPRLVLSPGGLPDDQRQLFEANDVPVFHDTGAAIEALNALFDAVNASDAPGEPGAGMALERAASTIELNEYESMALLDEAAVPTVPRRLVATVDEALAFAETVGWPVVLKGVVDGIAHKSDLGLVRIGINSPGKLRDEYQDLSAVIGGLATAGSKTSICVQKMVGSGFEIIVGVTQEPPLGRFLLVGTGGRYAEQIDDVHLWAMPATEQAVRSALTRTSVGRVLQGPRWPRKESFDEVVAVLMNVQRAAIRGGAALQAIEINPLWTGSEQAVALDALVVTAEPTLRNKG